jgi:hypothetical protein
MQGAIDWLADLPPQLSAALVAAVVALTTSIVTTLAAPGLKYRYDRRLETNKVEITYRSEQQKALRDHFARYKGLLLEAGESLNHRFWNFYYHEKAGWLDLRGHYFGDDCGYYAKSFAYRLLVMLSVIRLVERKSLYIDATVATAEDFNFLKALKLNLRIWTDTALFHGLTYDQGVATDHFFRDSLASMADRLQDRDNVIISMDAFSKAVQRDKHPYVDVFQYLDGVCTGEERYRFDRIVCAHLVLLATLNSSGYDYQQSTAARMAEAAAKCEHPVVLSNLEYMIRNLKLERDTGFQRLLSVLASLAAPDGSPAARRPRWPLVNGPGSARRDGSLDGTARRDPARHGRAR